jgi:hypothetical protein
MDKIVLERINSINSDDISSIQYYKSNTDIKYSDIIAVWEDFIKKRYIDDYKKDSYVNLNNKRYNSILKIGCLENIFGQMIEDFFKNFICTIEDELLIFFIKGQDKLLAIYKSYQPLLNDDKIRLPYWVYNIEAKKICTSLEKEFKKNETICILTYVIQ